MQAVSARYPEGPSVRKLKPELPALTTLRFFAAAMVVGYHCGFPAVSGTFLEDFFSNGYECVAFFFILSGFILAYVYEELIESESSSPRAVRTFWFKRFLRIYPAYLFALLISFPAFVYAVALSKSIPPAAFAGGLILVPLLLQSWAPALATTWNLPAWSLSVEAFLYACFPFSGRILRNSSPALAVVWSGFAAAAFGLALNVAVASPGLSASPFMHNLIRYFPLLHLPKFIFGIALGRAFLHRRNFAWTSAEIWLIGALVAIVLIFGLRSTLYPWVVSDAVLAPLFGLIIYAGASSQGFFTRMLGQRWLLELGEASYGLYILHIPVFFWWVRIFPVQGPGVTKLHELCQAAFFFIAATLLSVFSHRLVEPLIRRRLARAFQAPILPNFAG